MGNVTEYSQFQACVMTSLFSVIALTLSLLSSKSVFSQPFKKRWMSDVARICSIITFHLSKLWKVKFSILCDVIFLVRLQEKFDIDHSQAYQVSSSPVLLVSRMLPVWGQINWLRSTTSWHRKKENRMSTRPLYSAISFDISNSRFGKTRQSSKTSKHRIIGCDHGRLPATLGQSCLNNV